MHHGPVCTIRHADVLTKLIQSVPAMAALRLRAGALFPLFGADNDLRIVPS